MKLKKALKKLSDGAKLVMLGERHNDFYFVEENDGTIFRYTGTGDFEPAAFSPEELLTSRWEEYVDFSDWTPLTVEKMNIINNQPHLRFPEDMGEEGATLTNIKFGFTITVLAFENHAEGEVFVVREKKEKETKDTFIYIKTIRYADLAKYYARSK